MGTICKKISWMLESSHLITISSSRNRLQKRTDKSCHFWPEMHLVSCYFCVVYDRNHIRYRRTKVCSFFPQTISKMFSFFLLFFYFLRGVLNSLKLKIDISKYSKNLSYLAANLILGALLRWEKYPIISVTRFLPLKCDFGK